MIVNKHTKISEILEEKPETIEVIVSINKNFRKLENPLLRKMLASKVSVEAAAKVGNTDLNTLLKALEDIGFEVAKDVDNVNDINDKINTSMGKENNIELDVRPVLESGVDPFKIIMETLKGMDENQTLKIINTFEPIPILNILKGRGYEYKSERPEEGVVITYLHKASDVDEVEAEIGHETISELSYEQLEKKFAGKMIEIDVRELEMPMPMVSVLEAIETLEEDHALFVHHKRLPQYLLPELKEREFDYKTLDVDDNNMKLIIFRK